MFQAQERGGSLQERLFPPQTWSRGRISKYRAPKSQAEGWGPCLGCWEPPEDCEKGRGCRKTPWRHVRMDWRPGGWGGGWVRVPVGEGEACIGAGVTVAEEGTEQTGSRAGGPMTEWCLHTVGI